LQPGDAKLQVTTSLDYDTTGNIASRKVTGVGMPARTTTVTWDSRGQFPETVTNALSQSAALTWDPALGVMRTSRDPNLLTTSWDHDSFGRTVSEARPDGTSSTWSREPCSGCDARARYRVVERLFGTASAEIRATTAEIDRHERPFRASIGLPHGGTAVSSIDFDPRGRVSARSVRAFAGGLESGSWRYAYDDLDRIRSEELARPGGEIERSTKFEYDGLQTRITDPLNRDSVFIDSAWGPTLRVTDAAGRSTNYEHNAFGQPTRLVDPVGSQLSSITYNVRGIKTAQADMDLGSWTFETNALGEVTRVRDAKTASPNWTTVRTYDLLGRLTTRRDVPEGVTATFVHGSSASSRNIGRLESMALSDGSYSESYTYDTAGRLLRRRIAADEPYDFDYAYDASGLLKSLQYPASTGGYRLRVGYEYDRGYLARIVDTTATPSTEIWRLAAADPEARPIDERVGAVQVVTSLDPALGLVEHRTAGIAGSTTLQDLSYAWDDTGRLSTRADGNQAGLVETFEYDSLGRLDRSWRNGTLNLDVGYDAAGNITSKFEEGIGTQAYQYHATRKHAVVSAGAGTYAYDANGNMTARNGAAVAWYSFNLPSTLAASGGSSSQFWYGPDRRRWRQVSTTPAGTESTVYVCGLVEKVAKSGTTTYRHYIPTPGSASALNVRSSSGSPASATYYLLTDHLGSVDKVVDATSGTALVGLSYSAFGRRRGANWSGSPTAAQLTKVSQTTRDGFTGHEMIDSVGVVHMNGRVYDPSLGRFLSPDPYIPSAYDPQSLNRYSYVGNDPLSLTDPSGYSPDDSARPSLVCDDGCAAWYTATFQYGYVPYWPFGDPTSSDYFGTFLQRPGNGTGVPVPPGGSLPPRPKEPRTIAHAASFTGMGIDSVTADQAYLCARAGLCSQRPPLDYDNVVTMVAAVGDVLLGIATLWIVDGAEFRRVHDIGSVDTASPQYEAGFWGTVFASAGLGRVFARIPGPSNRPAAPTVPTGSAVSDIRFTMPGEQFIRYESGNLAFTRVKPTGGVTPGTFAAPASDGLVPVRSRVSTYNLPSPGIPRSTHVILAPPAGTAIVGPRPVLGGTGNEVLFPYGY
jgi:RHS repeat-associated protein